MSGVYVKAIIKSAFGAGSLYSKICSAAIHNSLKMATAMHLTHLFFF